jgi:hypothetical protein
MSQSGRPIESAPDALLKAVASGDHGRVKALLKAGSDPNQPDSEGTPALIFFEVSDLFTGFFNLTGMLALLCSGCRYGFHRSLL